MKNDPVIVDLIECVRASMSVKRFKHSIGVADMACTLGRLYLPTKARELYIAGILHDVAKEIDINKQIKIIEDARYPLTDEDLMCLPALHSITGALVIKQSFPDFVTEDILDAVNCHTLGKPGMSLFSKIIFISDFIECGREYTSSVKTREFLFSALDAAKDDFDLQLALNKAIYMSLEYTVEYLRKAGKHVHSQSINTKNAILALI